MSGQEQFVTDYETVAASQTDQILGAAGKQGDILKYLVIVPATVSPGAVSIKDGALGSSIQVFGGGAGGVVANLEMRPIVVPFGDGLGIRAVTAANGGWRVTTGANVTVIAIGWFH